jgi:NADH-quinone oxidoreductase subunit J
VNLLVQRKTINSALSLIVVMGSLALIYLLLGAEFVAVIQVIIYAGAIMVLFIFVIMLLNAGDEELRGSPLPNTSAFPACSSAASSASGSCSSTPRSNRRNSPSARFTDPPIWSA